MTSQQPGARGVDLGRWTTVFWHSVAPKNSVPEERKGRLHVDGCDQVPLVFGDVEWCRSQNFWVMEGLVAV